jgi:transcriptional regulator with XRE-family HTH domain
LYDGPGCDSTASRCAGLRSSAVGCIATLGAVQGDGSSALGSFVRRHREEFGLSQAALARRMSMSTHALGRLERGERGVPRPVEIRHWAAVLGVDESVLAALCRPGAAPGAPIEGDGAGDPGGPVLHEVFPDFFDVIARSCESVVIWQSWLPDTRFKEALGSALANGSTLRIIVLDPTCPAAIDRAGALGFRAAETYLRASLVKLVGELGSIGADAPAVVRLSRRLPPGPVYATEDRLLVSWFFTDGSSMVRPQVEVAAATVLARTLLADFDREWDRLDPLDDRAVSPG